MTDSDEPQSANLLFHLPLMVALILAVLLAPMVVAQDTGSGTFRIIHNFTGGKDGATPFAGLIIDGSGNLYGTTNQGGSCANTYVGSQ